MKQIFKKIVYLSALIINFSTYTTDSIITIFVQKYPYLKKSEIKKLKQKPNQTILSSYSKALKQPSYLYKNVLDTEQTNNRLPGIMAMYAGNVALSTPEGQISFPRLQQTSDMYLLITEKIIPAYMIAPATVHNWMIDQTTENAFYSMKLEHDKKTNLFYYQTTKSDLPKDNNIPLNTLIIIAHPETVFVPLGATIIDESPNIVLPTIYIKRNFCFIKNSLFTLATRQYFRRNHPSIKQDNQTVMLIEQPN